MWFMIDSSSKPFFTGSMILDKSNDKTSKEEFNNGMIQYSLNGVSDLPPPPPFPLPSEV